MGLFSDMGKFGLSKYEKADVLAEKNKMAVEKQVEAPVVKVEEDFLYDKHYECPVCGLPFVSKSIKIGRVKAVGKDTDLRPIYDQLDPIKYDIITCDKCGYSSITRYFGKLSTRQARDIKAEIGTTFSGIDNSMSKFSYDDAILRYKLAVISSIVKNAKNSERAYTCLKLAWIIRGKRLSLDKNDEAIKGLYEDELECLKNAYDGFVKAISNEPFPIAGMDENTLKYILADLARKLKKYEESARFIASVLQSRAASSRLKDEALKLKELVKQEKLQANYNP